MDKKLHTIFQQGTFILFVYLFIFSMSLDEGERYFPDNLDVRNSYINLLHYLPY